MRVPLVQSVAAAVRRVFRRREVGVSAYPLEPFDAEKAAAALEASEAAEAGEAPASRQARKRSRPAKAPKEPKAPPQPTQPRAAKAPKPPKPAKERKAAKADEETRAYTAPPLGAPVWVSSLAINILALGLPLVILQVYDRILPHKAYGTFALLLLGLAAVLVLDAALKIARAHVVGWMAAQFEHVTATEIVGRFLNASSTDIEREPPGVHLDRLQAIDTLREFYGGQSRLLLVDVPFLFVFLGLVWIIGGIVVLVPIVMIGVLGAVSYFAGRALKARLTKRAELDDRRYSFIIEALTGIQTIKTMAMEPLMQRRYERLQQTGAASTYNAIILGNVVQTVGGTISNLTMILIVSVGALEVIAGDLSVGGLAACTLLGGRTLQPLLRGMSVWTQLQSLEVARKRAADLSNLPKLPERPPRPIENLVPEVAFRNVEFGYEPGHKLFDGFSLIVKPGEMVALTGPEGDGKSTLLKLIMGEIEPLSGEVAVGGYPASGEFRDDLALDISYLPPQAKLFSGTILDNLTMFSGGEAIDRAREAARMIGLEDDIHRLPQGYDTEVSQGVADELPQGMLRRIAIARGLARTSRIMLFDEANAGLDRSADTLLIDAIGKLKGNVTIIAVSHRPSLIRLADRVVSIHRGKARLRRDFAPAAPQPQASRPLPDEAAEDAVETAEATTARDGQGGGTRVGGAA